MKACSLFTCRLYTAQASAPYRRVDDCTVYLAFNLHGHVGGCSIVSGVVGTSLGHRSNVEFLQSSLLERPYHRFPAGGASFALACGLATEVIKGSGGLVK